MGEGLCREPEIHECRSHEEHAAVKCLLYEVGSIRPLCLVSKKLREGKMHVHNSVSPISDFVTKLKFTSSSMYLT